MIFARKIDKIPEFYMIFARENARILHNNCPKNIFPICWGHVPPSAVSYTYGSMGWLVPSETE